MQRFWSFLLDPRALTVIGVLALAALLLSQTRPGETVLAELNKFLRTQLNLGLA